MSKASLSERIGAGDQAQRELGLFDRIAGKVRGRLLNLIAESSVDDKAMREDAYMMIKALPKLRLELENEINDGAAAEHELKAMQAEDAAGAIIQ